MWQMVKVLAAGERLSAKGGLRQTQVAGLVTALADAGTADHVVGKRLMVVVGV